MDQPLLNPHSTSVVCQVIISARQSVIPTPGLLPVIIGSDVKVRDSVSSPRSYTVVTSCITIYPCYHHYEQMHRKVPLGSNQFAVHHYTWWTCRSDEDGNNNIIKSLILLTLDTIDYSTSGWNCCSVLVWQYGQESPRSQWAGSLHSSFSLTLGQGVDLCRYTYE